MNKKAQMVLKMLMYLLVFTGPMMFFFHPVSAASYQFDNSISSQDQQAINQMLAPVNRVYNAVRISSIAIATLVLLFAGILYVTSKGDVSQKERAKNMISYVVIGLLIVVIAPSVVQYLVV